MEIGLFSNSQRFSETPTEDFAADLRELVVADEAGYREAWISEHLGSPLAGAMTAPELLIAHAAGLTSRIRLGSGVRQLPLFHPLDVATQAAVNDHLSGGRYNLGIGTGFGATGNLERRGIDPGERVPRALEALELLRACWAAEEPFDFDGAYYRGRGIAVAPRPLQAPHPPICVASDDMAPLAAAHGYGVLMGYWDDVAQLRRRVEAYVRHAEAAGVAGARGRIRVARMIFVAEDRAEAREALRGFVERDVAFRMRFNAGVYRAFLRDGETLADLDYDVLLERDAFVVGDPDDVTRKLTELFDALGGFGTVLYVTGKDAAGAQARERSLRLFASDVAPRLPSVPAPASAPAAPAP